MYSMLLSIHQPKQIKLNPSWTLMSMTMAQLLSLGKASCRLRKCPLFPLLSLITTKKTLFFIGICPSNHNKSELSLLMNLTPKLLSVIKPLLKILPFWHGHSLLLMIAFSMLNLLEQKSIKYNSSAQKNSSLISMAKPQLFNSTSMIL